MKNSTKLLILAFFYGILSVTTKPHNIEGVIILVGYAICDTIEKNNNKNYKNQNEQNTN